MICSTSDHLFLFVTKKWYPERSSCNFRASKFFQQKLYAIRKRRSTHFEDVRLWKGRSGYIADACMSSERKFIHFWKISCFAFLPQVYVWHTKTEVASPPRAAALKNLNLTVPLRETNLLNLYAEITTNWRPCPKRAILWYWCDCRKKERLNQDIFL